MINHLVNHYDCGAIKEVRTIEKCKHKLVKHRGSRTFSLRCLQEQFIPTGCRIKFKGKTI